MNSAIMTQVPSIDANHQVNEVQLSGNPFILSGADDFKRFPQTASLNLNSCGLTSFPDFTHIGQTLTTLNFENNPIEVISKELLSKLPRLVSLNLKNTEVMAVPCVFGTALDTLNLHGTPMTDMPCVPSSLNSLVFDHGALKRVDARHAVSLSRLSRLFVRSGAGLEEVHDYMNLGQTNWLSFSNNPNLDVCKCQHAWMKIAAERGSHISVTDKACGDNGEMWTELNSTRLLELCDDSTLQGKYYLSVCLCIPQESVSLFLSPFSLSLSTSITR
jgi:hypothetical protein